MEEYYCTNCNQTVNEKDKICSNCGAKLSKTIEDVNKQKSVVVKTYITMFEAEAAQEYLRGCGIDSYISKDDAGGMYPLHSSSFNNIKLIVLESIALEAQNALSSLEEDNRNSDENLEDK